MRRFPPRQKTGCTGFCLGAGRLLPSRPASRPVAPRRESPPGPAAAAAPRFGGRAGPLLRPARARPRRGEAPKLATRALDVRRQKRYLRAVEQRTLARDDRAPPSPNGAPNTTPGPAPTLFISRRGGRLSTRVVGQLMDERAADADIVDEAGPRPVRPHPPAERHGFTVSQSTPGNPLMIVSRVRTIATLSSRGITGDSVRPASMQRATSWAS